MLPLLQIATALQPDRGLTRLAGYLDVADIHYSRRFYGGDGPTDLEVESERYTHSDRFRWSCCAAPGDDERAARRKGIRSNPIDTNERNFEASL